MTKSSAIKGHNKTNQILENTSTPRKSAHKVWKVSDFKSSFENITGCWHVVPLLQYLGLLD